MTTMNGLITWDGKREMYVLQWDDDTTVEVPGTEPIPSSDSDDVAGLFSFEGVRFGSVSRDGEHIHVTD